MSKSVTIVWWGTSAAIAALNYYNEWYNIEVYTKWPEPTLDNISSSDIDFYASSMTWWTDIQRFITWIEWNPWNFCAFSSHQCEDWSKMWKTTISEWWWLEKEASLYSKKMQNKIKNRALFYNKMWIEEQTTNYNKWIIKNKESLSLRKKCIIDSPELFKWTEIQWFDSGVLKLFLNQKYFEKTYFKFKRLDLLAKKLTFKSIVNWHEMFWFREKWINISKFTYLLVKIKDLLMSNWVKFYFDNEIKSISLNRKKIIEWIVLSSWEVVHNQNFSFHLWAYNSSSKINAELQDIVPVWWLWSIVEIGDEVDPFYLKHPMKLHTTKEGDIFWRDINISRIDHPNKNLFLAWYWYIVSEHAWKQNSDIEFAKTRLHSRFETEICRRFKKKDIKSIKHIENICYRSFTPTDRETLYAYETWKWWKAIFCSGWNTWSTTISFKDAKLCIDILNNKVKN